MHVPSANDARRRTRGKGMTLIELLVVIAIVSILAAAVMPLSRMTVRRVKETELRSSLRTLRTAIDAFNRDCTTTDVKKKLATDNCDGDKENWPESLEVLTEPLKMAGTGDKTRKYLRRIPSDPFTPLESADQPNNWGLRSYKDDPDSTQWGGGNVYDVYSKSEGVALDGTKYNTW
jgi:general secretion pathway protein G